MDNFSKHVNLEPWLKQQPRDVMVVFAARSALRAVPTLATLFGNAREKPDKSISIIILPLLYGMATALSAGTWPGRVVDTRAAAAFPSYPNHAAHAAAYAADVADAADDAKAATYATKAAENAALAAGTANYVSAPAACNADATLIVTGQGAADLAFMPLWPDGKILDELQKQWHELKTNLHELNEDWQVWTSWYEGILMGGARDANLEIARISFPTEDYTNAVLVNAKIKDLYRKPIPPQNPATVRPIDKEGKLYSDRSPLTPDVSDQLALDNLLSLKDEMLDMVKTVLGAGNIDKHAANYMQTTAGLIPGTLPNSKTIMRLVRREAVLLKFEPTVKAQWPDMLAAQYSALCTELTNVLDQFSDRREYRRQQLDSELEDFADDELADEMTQLNDLFRSQTGRERIDKSIPADIDGISTGDPDIFDLSPEMINAQQTMIRADQFESANNVLKALASGLTNDEVRKKILYMAEHRYADGFAKGLDEGAFEAGKLAGERLAKTATNARAAQELAKAVGKKLSEKYPKTFGWLNRHCQ